jgi:hypothetical protein
MTSLRLVTAALLLALAAGPAVGKGKPERQGQPTAAPTSRTEVVVDIVFTAVERRLIEEFFGRTAVYPAAESGGKGMPPGLAKRGDLPPGLARRDRLPPGLAKRALPNNLNGRLGPPPVGAERYIVGNDILLIQVATGLVLDVLYDVVTQK